MLRKRCCRSFAGRIWCCDMMSRTSDGPRRVTVINPDHFLEVDGKRIWTPQRNKLAWEKCFCVLEEKCRKLDRKSGLVLLVCGVQGAGKSSWIRNRAESFAPCICFDAALPKARHRRPVVEIVRRAGVPIKAVYIDVPIEVALFRNMARPKDERVAEAAIRSVFSQFEAPTRAEGSEDILRIDGMA